MVISKKYPATILREHIILEKILNVIEQIIPEDKKWIWNTYIKTWNGDIPEPEKIEECFELLNIKVKQIMDPKGMWRVVVCVWKDRKEIMNIVIPIDWQLIKYI